MRRFLATGFGTSAACARFVTSVSTFQNLPKFEVHDVRDDPVQGTMTRVSVDGKSLLISQYPQLGPRKIDPNDLSPQFDRDRRISVRVRHTDLAGLVCVCQGRLQSYPMQNRAYTLSFEKSTDGFKLQGKVHRVASQTVEDWAVNFDSQVAVTLSHFLDSALTESFGFRQFYAAQATAASADGAAPKQGGTRNRRRSNGANAGKQGGNNNNNGNTNKAKADAAQ